MRTSTFKRNWMLHYIQPEYLYLPRRGEKPEPHPEGTTRVYFQTNNFNFFAEDGSGIILAVYDSKGKIIFCSHYKNNQGVHLYNEVYSSSYNRYYYYKIISTPYISTSYTIDSNNFLILPPGKYYYRYVRDTMQYAEIERYKLYNFTIPETESTGITSKFIDINGLALEYLNVTVEANLKDISQEERWTVETGIYNYGVSVTYPTGGTDYSPYTLIGPSSYIILKYNIVQGNQIINTIERGKIPRANYSHDVSTGFHTGKVGENDVYEIFRVNSVRQSLGTIQDYWIDYGRISGASIAEYRGGFFDYNGHLIVYIHDPIVRKCIIEFQEDVVNSSISYNVQSAQFQVTYNYLLFGYTYIYYGVSVPKIITRIDPDLEPATWQNTVDTFLSETFKTIREYTYSPQYTSISSNVPVNIVIGKENNWSEDSYYNTDDVYVGQGGDCDFQQNSHNITYNFSMPSIDTSLMDGYEEIMFEAENWDLRNKKLNKNFYRYYNNGQDIPFYDV